MKFRKWFEADEERPLKIVDTSDDPNDNQYKLGNAAGAREGHIIGWHVTDHPQKVAEVLLSGKKLTASYGPGRGRGNELGPGLYISGVPRMWMNRSIDKWEFMDRLTPDEKQRLAAAIVKEAENRSLTNREKETLERDIKNFLNAPGSEGKQFIMGLAGLPYAIHFWEPDFLEPLGIQASNKPPEQVEVIAKGRFVDLSDQRIGGLQSWRPYLMQGFDGAFLKSSFEVVIWRNEAIIKFGDYYPSSSSSGSS